MKRASLLILTAAIALQAPTAMAQATKLTSTQKAEFLKVVGGIGTINNAITLSETPTQNVKPSVGADVNRILALAKTLQTDCQILKGEQPESNSGGAVGTFKSGTSHTFAGAKCPITVNDSASTDGKYDTTAEVNKVEATLKTRREYAVTEPALVQELGVKQATVSVESKVESLSTKEKIDTTTHINGSGSYTLADGTKVAESLQGKFASVSLNNGTLSVGALNITYKLKDFTAVLTIELSNDGGVQHSKTLLNGEAL